MNKPAATRLVNKLRYNLSRRRNLKTPEGPVGRHNKIRKVVTALFKYERLELNYSRGDESRGYAERLISDAIRYGDCHKPTMDNANYWLLEKQVVHKLFKVLAPRYQNYDISYTKMWRAPKVNSSPTPMCVLELRNNVYPPLGPDRTNHKNLIHNVLLQAAKQAYEMEKVAKKVKEATSTLQENMNSPLKESSESLKSSETKEEISIGEEKENKEESECQTSETVQMADKNEKEIPSVENLKDNSSIDKDLNLDKMKITDKEETESSKKGSD